MHPLKPTFPNTFPLTGKLYQDVTLGNREFIYARVLREPSNSKDKWLTFMAMLLESWQTKNYFAYTVELKLRDGEVYGSVSFEIPKPEVKYTKENGVIAIDTNASPIHLAIAEAVNQSYTKPSERVKRM